MSFNKDPVKPGTEFAESPIAILGIKNLSRCGLVQKSMGSRITSHIKLQPPVEKVIGCAPLSPDCVFVSLILPH
jgi:hypothetical protein